jgi:methyl acetate hydrolase
VHERITGPLGLRDVGVLDDERRRRLASMHVRREDGMLVPIDFALPVDVEFDAGGHFLYGTVVDYARLLRVLLRGGELDGVRILQEATVRAGLSNQLGTLRFRPIRTAIPSTTHDVDPFPGVPGTWGWFGLINLAPTASGRSAGSSFWAGLANTYWWLDPGRGVAGVIATQILPFADTAVLALQGAVERTAVQLSR